MIFPGFPGVLSFFQVFQVEWEPCNENILFSQESKILHVTVLESYQMNNKTLF